MIDTLFWITCSAIGFAVLVVIVSAMLYCLYTAIRKRLFVVTCGECTYHEVDKVCFKFSRITSNEEYCSRGEREA